MPVTLYKGFDVLEVEPDSSEGRGGDESQRRRIVLGPEYGTQAITMAEPQPRVARTIQWTCKSHAEVTVLRTFLDTRRGRAVPFWLPTLQRELQFSGFPGFGSAWTVKWIGYTANMFPLGQGRRHVFVWHPTAGLRYAKVTAAVDNGNGTETLTLEAGMGVNIANSFWVPGFLRLCRLGEDRNPIRWLSQQVAVADLQAVEVPAEAP